jgi:hypothetical protein
VCAAALQEYEDAAEDEYVSEHEDTDVDEDDEEGPALPLHLEQALGENALGLRCNRLAWDAVGSTDVCSLQLQ